MAHKLTVRSQTVRFEISGWKFSLGKYETHSVYVQNVDIRGRKECVLHERCKHVPRVHLMRGRYQRLDIIFKLKPRTWMTDAMTYNPIVATSDRTISRNIVFEKRSLNLAPRCSAAATSCTPLIDRKIAANCVRPPLADSVVLNSTTATHRHIERKNGISYKRKRVGSVGALRSISEGKNEASE
jgi:hypothetical protein